MNEILEPKKTCGIHVPKYVIEKEFYGEPLAVAEGDVVDVRKKAIECRGVFRLIIEHDYNILKEKLGRENE